VAKCDDVDADGDEEQKFKGFGRDSVTKEAQLKYGCDVGLN
jgi:hypothetical protein